MGSVVLEKSQEAANIEVKTAWKIVKWLLISLVCLFILIQLKRPARTNPAIDQSQTIEAHTQMTPQVKDILDRSCRDCHSNKTEWPWYTNVAPVSWFVIDHVNEGRRNLNFSEWGRYTKRDTVGLFKQICQEVKSGSMPLSYYTPLHPGSKLSPADVTTLCDWATPER